MLQVRKVTDATILQTKLHVIHVSMRTRNVMTLDEIFEYHGQWSQQRKASRDEDVWIDKLRHKNRADYNLHMTATRFLVVYVTF